jgi:hypothetical protein
MTATYEYGSFTQYDLDTDEHDNYLYSLRQFVMMRRCGRPFADWQQVMDYTAEWFEQRPDLNPNEKKTYAGWSGSPEVWVF